MKEETNQWSRIEISKIDPHKYSQLIFEKGAKSENFLVVQWIGLCAFTAEGLSSIPHGRIKVPEASLHGQKERERKKEEKAI